MHAENLCFNFEKNPFFDCGEINHLVRVHVAQCTINLNINISATNNRIFLKVCMVAVMYTDSLRFNFGTNPCCDCREMNILVVVHVAKFLFSKPQKSMQFSFKRLNE